MTAKRALYLALLLPLIACGGGGGGSNITLSPSSLELDVLYGDSPASTIVQVQFSGDGFVIGTPPGVANPTWLSIAPVSVDATHARVVVMPSRSAEPGRYQTTLRFVAGKLDGTVLGVADLPVTLVVTDPEPRWQWLADTGAAFVAGPAGDTLSKVFTLLDSTGAADPSWTATPDQPWLQVTRVDGAHLRLDADPASLAPGLHLGAVVVRSANAAVSGVDTIRVGLTVQPSGVKDGCAAGSLTSARGLAADPIRPRFFAWSGTSSLQVIDAYSGALLSTLTPPAGTPGNAAVSPDGALLYVEDASAATVHVYDLVADAWLANLPGAIPMSGLPANMEALRLGGADLLVVGDCLVDAASGTVRGGLSTPWPSDCYANQRVAVAPEASAVVATQVGYSPSYFHRYDASYLPRAQRALVRSSGSGQTGSNGKDVAVTPDGTRVATAAGGGCGPGYDGCLYQRSGASYAQVGVLQGAAYPVAVEAGRRGEWYFGIDSGTVQGHHVAVFGATGSLLGGFDDPSLAYVRQGGIAVSADGQRVLVASSAGLCVYPSIH